MKTSMARPRPRPAHPDEHLVITRAQRGDKAAWETLLERYGPLVYGLCVRMCTDADDAYQTVWERVFANLHRFDPAGRGSLRSWLATITHRHLVDRHRRSRVRGEVVPLSQLPPVAPDADERIARRQRQARLEAALQRLPEAQRRVVVLHHLEGVALEAIAVTEGVALGTVKSRLYRGRARLAELLR